jgi:Ca2+-binding RTX toxin-like protein
MAISWFRWFANKVRPVRRPVRTKDGNDILIGGDGNDTLTGGDGDDQVFGQGGNDRIVWSPGDDTDLNEGGDGVDTVEVNGGNGAEVFTATANGTRVRFDRITPAPFSIDIGTCENLVVNMNGGDDAFSASGNLAALIQITVDGGAGNDTILGGNGADTLLGGDGNDLIDGKQGNDVVILGAGDDVFRWDPGDGSDVVEGGDGFDTVLFNGANISENIDISANGGRVRFFRDVASVTMDLNGVEGIDFNDKGGADTILVNDLSGTDVVDINVDLAGVPGSGIGDGQADNVVVNASSGDDVIVVGGDASGVAVLGLAARVNVTGAEAANDRLTVNALAGDDVVEASGASTGAIQLMEDGGDGDDVLIGGAGNDTLLGEADDDVLIGGPGQDVLDGGPGNNILIQGKARTSDWGIEAGTPRTDHSSSSSRPAPRRDFASGAPHRASTEGRMIRPRVLAQERSVQRIGLACPAIPPSCLQGRRPIGQYRGISPIRATTCSSVLCAILRDRLTEGKSSSSSPSR